MSAVNPCTEYGGLFNYSKFRVLSLLPKEQLLRACLVSCSQSNVQIKQEMDNAGLDFPLIAKPDFGERGEPGEIRSICAKKPLCVEGDGKNSLGELIARSPRSANRYRLLHKMWGADWESIVPAGQSWQLTHIGTHGLGTDCCDIRAASWEDVLEGKFKVIELNGVNAEPLHIYDPQFSVWMAWKTLWQHRQCIRRLAEQMRERGYIFDSALLQAIRQHDQKIRLYRKSSG